MADGGQRIRLQVQRQRSDHQQHRRPVGQRTLQQLRLPRRVHGVRHNHLLCRNRRKLGQRARRNGHRLLRHELGRDQSDDGRRVQARLLVLPQREQSQLRARHAWEWPRVGGHRCERVDRLERNHLRHRLLDAAGVHALAEHLQRLDDSRSVLGRTIERGRSTSMRANADPELVRQRLRQLGGAR